MPKARCCSRRSIRLTKVNTIKATRAAHHKTAAPKTASPKSTSRKKGKPCLRCKKRVPGK